MLGTCVGAVAAGAVRLRDGRVIGGFVRPWLAPFPLAVGALALVLFAFLAAVYLTLESEGALRSADTALLAGFNHGTGSGVVEVYDRGGP